LEDGYWRSSFSSTDVRSCKIEGACSGVNSNITGNYCREGHTGPHCSVCLEGYGASVSGLCEECEERTGSVVLFVVFVVVAIFAVIVFDKLVYRRYKTQLRGFKTAARIVFVAQQILATFPSIIPEIELPKSFLSTIKIFNVLKLDFAGLLSLGCVGGFDFHTKLIVFTVLPPVICGLLWVIGRFAAQSGWMTARSMAETAILVLIYAVLPRYVGLPSKRAKRASCSNTRRPPLGLLEHPVGGTTN